MIREGGGKREGVREEVEEKGKLYKSCFKPSRSSTVLLEQQILFMVNCRIDLTLWGETVAVKKGKRVKERK